MAAAAVLVVLTGVLAVLALSSARAPAAGSQTPLLDAAVNQVSQEVSYVHSQAPHQPTAYLKSLAALDYSVAT